MNYELIEKHSTGYSVSVAANRVTSFRKNTDEKTTVRVYDGGYIGIAGAIGRADTEKLRSEAVNNLKKQIAYPFDGWAAPCTRKDPAPKAILSAREMVPVLERLLRRLEGCAGGYIFGNKINLSCDTTTYENDGGTRCEAHDAALDIALTVKDRKSANIMDMVYGVRKFAYDEDAIVSEIMEMIAAYEHPVPMPDRGLPVVVDQGVFSPMLAQFSAELYASGAGLLSGKRGERVFGEKVDILLDRNRPYTGRFFDAEGVVNEGGQFFLVRHGVLEGLLTTKRTAKQFSLPIAGCAESAYDSVPQAGVRGIRFGNTAEGLAAAGDAILVSLASGGDMTPTGDLGIPVQLAFLLKDGKPVARLPELMLSGNVFDILGKGFRGALALPDGDQRIVADFQVRCG